MGVMRLCVSDWHLAHVEELEGLHLEPKRAVHEQHHEVGDLQVKVGLGCGYCYGRGYSYGWASARIWTVAVAVAAAVAVAVAVAVAIRQA